MRKVFQFDIDNKKKQVINKKHEIVNTTVKRRQSHQLIFVQYWESFESGADGAGDADNDDGGYDEITTLEEGET